MLYFDAYTVAGPRNKKHPAQPWRLEEVLAEMEHCSISGALVASTMSVVYDPMTENLKLSQALAGHDHLFAIWNVMPHQTGEVPPPAELGRLMDAHDVRAVSLTPATNSWDLEADHSQELLDWLEQRQTLTVLERGQFGHYRELDAFLTRHPGLPVLLTLVRWSDQRLVVPLMQKHPNLHLTFDNFQINYGPEWLVELGLENQMLYGSNAPQMSMGAHRAYIDYADLPPATREKIASGNLIRLLRGQRPPRERVNSSEDELMRAARQGLPLPFPVVDMHMHILDEGLNGAGGAYVMQRGGPRATYALLARLGVKGGGFMSWNGTVSPDSIGGNITTARALDANPGGYFGLATFDPTHFSQDELKRMIPATYADPRFVGMKPYVMYGVEYHNPSYDIWWQYGNERGYYALIHRTRGDFHEVDVLAENYPNVRWLVAHCGANYQTADGVIECIRRHPKNVYAEITLTPVTLGVIDYMAKHAGADRVVYGSDLPMRDPRPQLGWVVFSRLSLEDKRKILWTNALDILAPCWEQLPAANRPPRPGE